MSRRLSPLQKFARFYRGVALLFLNTALLGAIVAGFAFLFLRPKPGEPSENPLARYGLAKLQPIYSNRSPEEIVALLDETWSRPLIYEPYTQFTEAPFTGRFVNVSEGGFRRIGNQGPWQPGKENINVFVFGGSTTFGYGVADDETIPSILQGRLREKASRSICVYNFGRGHAFAKLRRRLLLRFLGRHFGRLKFFQHQPPMLMVAHHGCHRGVRAQVKIRLRLFFAVTRDAVGFDEGTHRSVWSAAFSARVKAIVDKRIAAAARRSIECL